MENQFDNNDGTEFVNPQKKKFWKLIFIFVLLGIGFVALLARLVNLQIIDRDKYRKIAKVQHESRVNLKAERGNIYDRKGRLLASTIKSYSFALDPTILKDTNKILDICNLVSIAAGHSSPTDLYQRVIRAKGAFVWLVRGLMSEQAKLLDSIKVRGFIRIIEPKRNYLYGSIASQVIGCTDIDNRGLTGIELSYDSLLKGADSYVIMLRDAAGRLIPTPTTALRRAVRGNSVSLTIDIELQRIAEYELKLGVQKSKAEAGTVVIINPRTGEILAMASYPGYDPNNIVSISSANMRNRAINDVYEPGSTFKLITAAAALEEGIAKPGTILDGHGGLVDYGGYKIIDEHKTGKITFARAMEISSNVIFSNLAYRIPPNKLFKYVRDFGFGLLYGVTLSGEAKGNIKSPAQLDAVSRRFLGFGYGISVTPLQMLNAYATVANEGVMMKPFVVSSLSDDNNKLVESFSPVRIRRVVSETTAEELTQMLIGVVENGTGKEAKITGVKIAGKTGTAQIFDSSYSKVHYTASFAGYLPANNPQIAMLIIFDKPKGNIYGGATAAPVFRKIAQSWISVSDNVDEFIDDDNENEIGFTMPDLSGFDYFHAVKILRGLGLAYKENKTNFIVASQTPKPGTEITNGSKMLVKLYPSKK
jgi:cell division protein FtsI (penicillin-binding protein 3)